MSFIGVGEHPKIPFGVYIPQVEHPYTYLILEFDNKDYDNKSNYGHTDRLHEIWTNRAILALRVVGSTSGAVGIIQPTILAVDPAVANNHYKTELIFRPDRYTDFNPQVKLQTETMVYIPIGGMTIATYKALSVYFEGDVGAFNVHKQLQQDPYDSGVTDDKQYVPSFGPGLYTDWVGWAGGDPLKWGYVELGDQDVVNVPVTSFFAPATAMLENLHIGIATCEVKGFHVTHGFASMYIPAPEALLATQKTATQVRIEGNFFVERDATSVIPDYADITTFTGSKGGSWVYLRRLTDGVVLTANNLTFETGNAAMLGLRTVLGIDGLVQPSDGHVLTATFPIALVPGSYDVIVRNIRPYLLKAAGVTQYHSDTSELLAGLTIV